MLVLETKFWEFDSPLGHHIYGMKLKAAVFVHHPQCSIQSAHGIVRTLYDDFDIDCIGKPDLNDRKLKKYDILCVPGGIGDSDTWHAIMEDQAHSLRNFTARGRRYLGICMGAYWAGQHYLKLLDGVDAVQYIKRPGADILRSFGTVASIDWLGQNENMYFYDGCSLLGDDARFRTIARYSNGDAAAIIQDNIGCIGPHPESDVYWYSKKFMRPYWHEYRHHELLRNFVKEMFV